MELALFPIAALLLLLSGASAPAHAAEPQPSAAALMRGFLGTFHIACACPGSRPSSASPIGRVQAARTQGCCGTPRAMVFMPQAAPPPGAFTHKQYRTRFGFADGAYQAIGPPSGGPHPDLGWFRE